MLEDSNHDGVYQASSDYSDPTNPDTDGDGILDGCEDYNQNGVVDTFPAELNPKLADTDGDGIPDGLEDANHNGVFDPGETDGTNDDTDADGFPDGAEDRNHDGLWNCPENLSGPPCELNPRTNDTDGDGLLDFVELRSQTDTTFYLFNASDGSRSTAIPDAACNGTGAVRFYGKDGKVNTDDDQTCPWKADSDDDGLTDGAEDRNGDGRVSTSESNPRVADTDGDGLDDGVEDANHDGLYDPLTETDPTRLDTDKDGLPDGTEDSGGCLTIVTQTTTGIVKTTTVTCDTVKSPLTGDLACNCAFWHDGVRQPIESDPRLADTDGDGLKDGIEDQNGDGIWERPIVYDVPRASDETSATHSDSDGDGLSDGGEDLNGNGQIDFGETDARRADPDFDCLNDAYEVFLGTDPFNADTDGDGLPDGLEVTNRLKFNDVSRTCEALACATVNGTAYQTDTCPNPKIRDSDGDGIVDGFEILNGYKTGEDGNADGCQESAESNPCVADTQQPPVAGGDPACAVDASVKCSASQIGSCTACTTADMRGCHTCDQPNNPPVGGTACGGDPTCSGTNACSKNAPCNSTRQKAQALICASGNIKPVVLVRSIDNDYTVALPAVRGPFGQPNTAYEFQELTSQGAPMGHAFDSLNSLTSPDTSPQTRVFGAVLRLGTLQLPSGAQSCDAVLDNPAILDKILPAPAAVSCVPAQNYVVTSSSQAPSDVAQRAFLRISQQLTNLGYTFTRTPGGNLAAHDDESASGTTNASIISRAIDSYTVRKAGAIDPYQLKRIVASALIGGNAVDNDLNAPATYASGSVATLKIEFFRRVVSKRTFAADGASSFPRIVEYGALFALAPLQADCSQTTGAGRSGCQKQVEPFTIAVDDLTNGTALGRYQADIDDGCDAYDPEKSKADFLVVLDDSGSMQHYIRAIERSAQDMAFKLQANKDNLDWRIGMTTSNMGSTSPGTGLLDEYVPFPTGAPPSYPVLSPPSSVQQLALYQTTAYDTNGVPQKCVYGPYSADLPLQSPYCCNYVGNGPLPSQDYFKQCCSIGQYPTSPVTPGQSSPVPAFYQSLKTAVTPNFVNTDDDTCPLFGDAPCPGHASATAADQTNDTLRCYDFPRVGENHEMYYPTAFYPTDASASPPVQNRQRNFLDYLCGDNGLGNAQRPIWGARGELWPPGFQGYSDPSLDNGRQDGANLLVRNADMLVTQMNRDCANQQAGDYGNASIRAHNGSGNEHGLQAAKRALERATAGGRTPPSDINVNPYKLRQNAPVITVILSDEEDYAEKYKNKDRFNANNVLDKSARDHNQLPPAYCVLNGDNGCTVDYCQNTVFGAQVYSADAANAIPSARMYVAGQVVPSTQGNYCVAPATSATTAGVCSVIDNSVCNATVARYDGLQLDAAGTQDNQCCTDAACTTTVDCSTTFTMPTMLDLTVASGVPDMNQTDGANSQTRDELNLAQSGTNPTCAAGSTADCLPCARFLREKQYGDFFTGQCSGPDAATPAANDIRRYPRPVNNGLVEPLGLVYAITRQAGQQGGSTGACGSTYDGGDGQAYRDMALASGGRVADICLADTSGFSDFLDTVVVDAQGLGSPYRLTGDPLSSTIQVGVLATDGTFRLIKRSSISGFDYNSNSRSIAFFSTGSSDTYNQVTTSRDAWVLISYKVWTKKCGSDCALGDECSICSCSTNSACCTATPTFECKTPSPCVQGCGPCEKCDAASNQCQAVDGCGSSCSGAKPICQQQPDNSYSCVACDGVAIQTPCVASEGHECPANPTSVCVNQNGIPNTGTTCQVTSDTNDCCGVEKVCGAGTVCVLQPCTTEGCHPTAHCEAPHNNGPPADACPACPTGTVCAPRQCSGSTSCPPTFICLANSPGSSTTCNQAPTCGCPNGVCADCPVGDKCDVNGQCVPICAPQNGVAVPAAQCCTQTGQCCPNGETFDPTSLSCVSGSGCPGGCPSGYFCEPLSGKCFKDGG